MVIRLSKFVGRDQLPGDEVAFNRINKLFAAARKVQPRKNEAFPSNEASNEKLQEPKRTSLRLSPFVGRDQLPGDEIAFERINRLFARASEVKTKDKVTAKKAQGKRRMPSR